MSIKKSIIILLITHFLKVEGFSTCLQDESLEEHAKNSMRSVVLYVDNQTKCTFKLITQSLKHGEWTRQPPRNIPSGKCRSWATQSHGFLTGTNGAVDYKCFDSGTVMSISWDNPFIGSMKINSYLKAFKIIKMGGTGNNAVVTFLINEH